MTKKTNLRATLKPYGTHDIGYQGAGSALRRTNGILFPFTPTITCDHQVEYSQFELTHTNYQANSYVKTRNPTIQVTGMFASQTPIEAAYTVGVMHFLRVMSKMHFGRNDDDRGTPPPLLLFSAYGTHNFANVPVLIGGFTFNYDDTVDYVEVVVNGEPQQIPAIMTISMNLLPQYSPGPTSSWRLNEFANGTMYKGGFL